MLSSTLRCDQTTAGGTPAAPVYCVAPAPLTLPAIPHAIPKSVVFKTGDDDLSDFASWLVNARLLRVEHWTGNLVTSCERAMRDFVSTARPRPLAWMKCYFWDDAGSEMGSNHFHSENYQRKYNVKAFQKVGAITLHVDIAENLCHLNIGPMLRALEKRSKGLGQTILNTLDRGLDQSCRGMTPRSGIGWAQYIYWGCESNESMRAEEELDELVGNWEHNKAKGEKVGPKPTLNDIEGFKRKDYDDAMPGWAGTGRIQRWKLNKIRRYRSRATGQQREILDATLALAEQVQRDKRMIDLNDLGCFEMGCWEVVPFLLRWNGFQDPLGGIFDDVLNNEYDSGEHQMDVNAAFAFHDEPSLNRALKMLRRYLELMQLCEDLIRLIGKKMIQ